MSREPGPAPDAVNEAVLETKRLTLSFGNDRDAEMLFPYVHGETGRQVTDFLLWDGPDTVEDIAKFFRLHTTGTFVPHGFHWLLRDRHGELTGARGTPMGSIGMNQRGPQGRCSVGYWLAPPFWKKGIMTEGLTEVLRHGFEQLGVVKFEAEVFVDNGASAALLERIGFKREGTIRRAQQKRGRWVDEHLYGLVQTDLSPP
ncbi:MAG: N-acetyltransferase [Actinobacteria bacterium]|nr:MAG: N-acetyltransferase [Actinomycetota bacterium]